jgi:hypothetical protein
LTLNHQLRDSEHDRQSLLKGLNGPEWNLCEGDRPSGQYFLRLAALSPGGRGAQRPKAPVPAAKAALDEAGLGFEDLDAVTTHNPFAVNDLWPDPTGPAG